MEWTENRKYDKIQTPLGRVLISRDFVNDTGERG